MIGTLFLYAVREDHEPVIVYHTLQEDYVPIMLDHPFYGEPEEDMGCEWITMETLSYYVVNGLRVPTNACVMIHEGDVYYNSDIQE